MILHLTPAAKAEELLRWSAQRADQSYRGAPGAGFPDPEVFDLCDRLNAIRGVCTLQSCAGHPRAEGREWSCPGQVWLWLDEPTWLLFLETAPEFARRACIERLDVLFGRHNDDRAVVAVSFRGMDQGRAEFAWSADVVARCFERIGGGRP